MKRTVLTIIAAFYSLLSALLLRTQKENFAVHGFTLCIKGNTHK